MSIEDIGIFMAFLMVLLGFVFIGYSIFIFKKVVPKVDYHLNGWNYESDFWFTAMLRAQEYTSYSMFPSRAKKAGVYERYYKLDPWTRRHFIIHIGLALFGVVLMVISAIIDQLFPNPG